MGRTLEIAHNGNGHHENGNCSKRPKLDIRDRKNFQVANSTFNANLMYEGIHHPENFYPAATQTLEPDAEYSLSTLPSPNGVSSPDALLGEILSQTSTEATHNKTENESAVGSETIDASEIRDKDGEIAPSFGPKIHVAMFDPDTSRVKIPGLINQFFGRPALAYASHRFMSADARRDRKTAHVGTDNKTEARKYDKRKMKAVSQDRDAVNTDTFGEAIAEAYGLSRNQDPMRFYETAMRHSNSTIQYMIEHTVPRHKGVLGLKTEPGLVIDDPESLFEYAFDTGIDERVQFEVRRQLLVGMVCAELGLYIEKSGLERNLRQVNEVFDNNLFEGKKGASHRRDYVFIHDLKTNKVNGYYDASQFERDEETGELLSVPHDPQTERLVEESFEMRRIKGTNIDVRYDPRLKNMPAAAGKAIQDALKAYEKGEDGTVRPLVEGRKDLMGMMLVVDGDEAAADQVTDQIFDILVTSPLAQQLYDVVPDDQTNGSEDQSDDFNLGRRIRVKGIGQNNLPIQWEIIVQPLSYNMNGNSKIGEMDPKTDRYDGQWHDGYTTERHIKGPAGGMLKLMFPDEVYNQEGRYIDVVKEAGKTKNRKAELVRLP